MHTFAPSPVVATEKRSPHGRPQTPYDFNMLKSTQIQTAPQTPPGPESASEASNDITPPSMTSEQQQQQQQQQQRPSSSSPPTLVRTPPRQRSTNVRASLSFKHNTNKRDSGFAHSLDDKQSSSIASEATSSPPNNSTAGVCKAGLSPIPPTEPGRPGSVRIPSSPSSQPRKLTKRRQDRTSQVASVHRDSSQRIASFHGIEMDIPSGDFEELHLADSVTFSNRGSVFLNRLGVDKQFSELSEVNETSEEVESRPPVAAPDTIDEASAHVTPVPGQESTTGSEAADRVSRLTPGQRIRPARGASNRNSLRVLSAEENVFSLRVRSLYEQGDHNGAPTIPEVAADGVAHDGSDEPRALSVPSGTDTATSRPSSVLVKRSSLIYPGHPANTEIDRYGFIVPTKATEAGSDIASVPIQRVATSLQLVSQSPRPHRSIRRTLSSARSIRSRPSSILGPPPARTDSVRDPTLESSISDTRRPSRPRSRVFQSRGSRLIEDASDMLTLPPAPENSPAPVQVGETREARLARQREARREEKWRKMASISSRGKQGQGMTFDFDTRNDLLIKRTWKGIPDSWRASAWYSFLLTSAKRRGQYVADGELIEDFHGYQDESCADDVQIDIDVPRTIISHVMFRDRYKGGQRLLFRVLHAISLHFPGTGYVQGMASLAATLLCYYDEEHAFVMLVRLWALRGMDTLFRDGFGGLMSALTVFESDWLARNAIVATRLQALGVSSTAYGTRWYLTLFNMSMPFAAQLRVWDVFMLLGDAPLHTRGRVKPTRDGNRVEEDFGGADLDVLHAVSAALVDAVREILVAADFENTMKTLTSWIPVRDEDLLMGVVREEYKLKKKRKE